MRKNKTFVRILGAVIALFLIISMIAPAFATGDVTANSYQIGSRTSGVKVSGTPSSDFKETGYYDFSIEKLDGSDVGFRIKKPDGSSEVVTSTIDANGRISVWGLTLSPLTGEAWVFGKEFKISIVSGASSGSVKVVDAEMTKYDSDTIVTSIKKGSLFNLTLTIEDNSIVAAELDPNSITVTYSSSSFLREGDSITVNTRGTGYATFDIHLDELRYNGTGKDLSLTLYYEANGTEYSSSITYTVPGVTEYIPNSSNDDDDDDEDEDIEIDPLTPYIIVENYTYGGTNVSAGTEFNLRVVLRNTSTTHTLENIKMSMSPTGVFSMTSSSNTFYIDELQAGSSIQKDMTLFAGLSSVTDDMDANAVGMDFSFQYVSNDVRKDGTSSEKITIPVFYPDRFEYTEPTYPQEVYVGEEFNLSIPVVNKGRSTVYNLTAELVGADASGDQRIYLGNLEEGREEYIDFYIAPDIGGELEGYVLLSYEDANMQPIERVINFDTNVIEPYYPEVDEPYMPPIDMPDPEAEETGVDKKTLLFGISFVIVAATSAYITVNKIKHKRSEFEDETI